VLAHAKPFEDFIAFVTACHPVYKLNAGYAGLKDGNTQSVSAKLVVLIHPGRGKQFIRWSSTRIAVRLSRLDWSSHPAPDAFARRIDPALL
jgi:hypothetical protein